VAFFSTSGIFCVPGVTHLGFWIGSLIPELSYQIPEVGKSSHIQAGAGENLK
jgi:hypothetical protein